MLTITVLIMHIALITGRAFTATAIVTGCIITYGVTISGATITDATTQGAVISAGIGGTIASIKLA